MMNLAQKITCIALCLFSVIVSASNRLEKRAARLIKPYEKAMDCVGSLQTEKMTDAIVFDFFSETGLYKNSDIKQISSVISKMYYIQNKHKSLEKKEEMTVIIEKLEKVQKFIVESATTYYAFIVCRDIEQSYEKIDITGDDILLQINAKLALQGKSVFKGRALYQFVKQINIDSSRLHALFGQVIVSDLLVLQINALKIKLDRLKAKIVATGEYASQQRKTRVFKSVGVLFGFVLVIVILATNFIIVCSASTVPYMSHAIHTWALFGVFAATCLVVTVSELHTSMKYNIPVTSHSLFSGFTPTFWPLTWISRTE